MTELNAQPDASPAEQLRAASRLLRETASKATPGAREVAHVAGIGTCVRNPDLNFCVTVEHGWVQEGDAEWIALMSPEAAEPLADLLDSIATVHEQPSCDAPETCNRCAEPDPVIIDSLRVVLELTGRTA